MKWSGFLAVHNKSISLRRKARPGTTEEANESFPIIDCRTLFFNVRFTLIVLISEVFRVTLSRGNIAY